MTTLLNDTEVGPSAKEDNGAEIAGFIPAGLGGIADSARPLAKNRYPSFGRKIRRINPYVRDADYADKRRRMTKAVIIRKKVICHLCLFVASDKYRSAKFAPNKRE